MFKKNFNRLVWLLTVVVLLAACNAPVESPEAPTLETAPPVPVFTEILPSVTAVEAGQIPTSTSVEPVPTTAIQDTPSVTPPAEDYAHLGLTEAQVDSLLSLEQVDEYPLYTMHYYAEYEIVARNLVASKPPGTETWACSLFAALADPASRLYGRNFDWEFSPAVLLFTDPPDGYASVSMVDIAYLGFSGEQSASLTEKPLDELVGLLNAPYLPFDGVNEAGLAIGMAAVPAGDMPSDPSKETLGSLGVIRAVLDGAATVGEALEILQGYNIDFGDGPPIHYLVADAQGNAALLEYYAGEIHVLRNQANWHQATNFLNASVDSPNGQCYRYDAIQEKMAANQGNLTFESAQELLREVSQSNTQWSVVYGMSTGQVQVVMGRNYEQVHVFQLDMLEQ